MSKIYFVMPAYNESANIENVIKQWHPIVEKCGSECRLVIANDGSKDNTFEIMEQIESKYPQLVALDKPNSGHGATVLYLYRYAIENNADFIFQTDSDGQTDPNEFWEFHKKRNEYDFQIGHRYNRKDGLSRIFVTKVLKFVVWMMFHEWVVDANTPFRLMKTDALKEVLEVIPDNFFLSNVAITSIAQKYHKKMCFHKISFKNRQGGTNSINMKRIFKIGIKAIGDFHQINKNIRKKAHGKTVNK